MQRVMWMGTALQARRTMWVSLALTAVYVLAMAIEFYPPPEVPSKVGWLLFAEGGFAGPMIIASILSILMRRVEQRRVFVGFEVGYIFITLAIFYWTFTGEHDAQYQLGLLFIPLFGFLGVVGAGIIAACIR